MRFGGSIVVPGLLAAGLILGGCSWSTTTEGQSNVVSTSAAPTSPPPTSSTTEAVEPSGSGFVVNFDGNTGLDRFRTGVYHRDQPNRSKTWPGDHDPNCGPPTSSRTLTAADPADSFYLCRDHMMTSVGHVSAYSIAWLSPKQTFTDETRVSWDVNVTDLGGRQWWEVMLIPVDGPELTCISWLPCGSEVRGYPTDAVIVSNGPFGSGKPNLTVGGDTNALTFKKICDDLDPEGCASKATRRTWSLTDNSDGTLTVTFGEHTWTAPGAFPDGEWKVVLKDHSYTPDKDGIPSGYTWHWDNIIVK